MLGVFSLLYWTLEKTDCTYDIQNIVLTGAFYEPISWNVDTDKIEYMCSENVKITDLSGIGTVWFITIFTERNPLRIKTVDGTCVIKVHRQKCETYTGWKG